MGYKVYVKDKQNPKYEQWTRKTHTSRVGAIIEADKLRQTYKKPAHRKLFGKPQISIRKTRDTNSREFMGGFKI